MEAGSSRKRHAGASNNVSDTSTSRNPSLANIENKSYLGGGLKDTQHGVRYQLHLLMLILWRACVQKYFEFCLTSELTEAGKFDDIVFLSKTESNSKWKSRLLQVKHTTDTGKVITIKDFFTEKDGDYSLLKYFKSYSKINERCNTKSNYSIFSGIAIEDVILITNARYDIAGLKDCLEEIDIRSDELLNIPQNRESQMFKLKKVQDNKVLQGYKSKLENVLDFNVLIKLLVDRNGQKVEKKDKVFMEYYYPLMRDVFKKDKKNMCFSEKFIDGTNLPDEVKEFRKHFLSEKGSNMELKNFNWSITDGLAKEFQPEENPTIVRPAEFAQQFHNILKYFKKFEKLVEINEDNVAKVFQVSNGTNLTDRGKETFIANIRNLGGHVLIKKFSEIRFSTSFIRSSDEREVNLPECKKLKKTPNDLWIFRTELKKICDGQKLVDFNSLDQYKLKIGLDEFQTCEEGALERKLPKPFSDDDLINFFDKFKIIFNYPDQLDELLGNEIKEKHKSLDCTAFKSICESDLHSWLVERMVTFYTYEKAVSLFYKIETDIRSLELNGFNESYFANIPMKYQFKPIVQIQDFLQNESENCLKLQFEYFGLGPTRVVQTILNMHKNDSIEKIRKYTRRYGFIFMTVKQLDSKKIFKKICEGKKRWKGERWSLLVIECGKDESKIDQICEDYEEYFIKMIFMTHTNGEKITSGFTDLTVESQTNLYKNGKLILDPTVGEFNFSEAIDEKDQKELIDAETLHKFIEGESVQIESKIRDTDPIVCQYYMERCLKRLKENAIVSWMSMWLKENYSKDVLDKPDDYDIYSEYDFVKNAEPMVIVSDIAGGGKSSLLSSLSRKLMQYNERLWLFRIDLNDHTEFLDSKSKIAKPIKNSVEMVQFLLEMLQRTMESTFERNLFKNFLLKSSSLKFAFFFDGFDEISPDYNEVVLELLVQLKERPDLRVLVTTRPSMTRYLEDKLKVKSFQIGPLSETDQIEFLTNFYLNKFKNPQLSLDIERLKSFTKALIEKQRNDILDMDMSFTTNPLQLRMMTEVFNKTCQLFLNYFYNDVSECFPDKLNIFDLYEKYVVYKLGIYCTEKQDLNLTNLATRNDQKELRSLFETKHQYLAIFEIFMFEHHGKLLSPEEIKKTKSFIEEFRNGNERRGLVSRVVNNKPHFIHRTFAEYFVACFLGNSLINGKKIEFFEWFIQYVRNENRLSAANMKNWLEKNTIPEESLQKLKYAIFRCSRGIDFFSAVFQSSCNILIQFVCNCFANDGSYDLRFFVNWFDQILITHALNIDVLKLLVKRGYNIDRLSSSIHLQLMVKSIRAADGGDRTDLILQDDVRVRSKLYHSSPEGIFELNKKKFSFGQWLVKQIHSKNINYDNQNSISLLHASFVTRSNLTKMGEGKPTSAYSGTFETSEGFLSSKIADFQSDFDFHIRTTEGLPLLHWQATNCRGDQLQSMAHVQEYNSNFSVRVKVVEAVAASNQIDMLQWMLKPKENGGAGASVEKFREFIRDNIIVALQNKEFEFCQWLIDEEHLNVNSDKWEDMPLLHASFLHCDLEASKFLVKNGADLTAKNKDDHNALELAATVDNPEICEWLATIEQLKCERV